MDLKRDFVQGLASAGIVSLGLVIYGLGGSDRLGLGGNALLVALAGAVLAEWLKFGLTGRHLTASEVVQNFVVSGFLAASASPLTILQAPAAWSDLLRLSSTGAAATAVIYHIINFTRLTSSGKHLRRSEAALIVGTPYVVGGLLLLETPALLHELGNTLTAGFLADRPVVLLFVAGCAVVFGVNEIVANGLRFATKGNLFSSFRAHLALFLAAIAAITAPWIAAFGAGGEVASWPAGLRLSAMVLTSVLSQAGLWAEVYLLTGLLMDAIHAQPPSGDTVSAYAVQGMKKGMVYSGVFMGLVCGVGALAEMPAVRWLAASHPVLLSVLCGAALFPLLKTIVETFDGSQAFFQRVGKSYRKPALYLRGVVAGLGVGYALVLRLPEQEMLTRVCYGFALGAAAYAGVNAFLDGLLAIRGQGRIQSWRVYLVQSLLGGFIGAALGFYFDAVQVAVVTEKLERYLSAGSAPVPFGVYPLLSKWGFINLGEVTGGVSLLFAEALAGVISWSVPAWLFALNRTFMAAYFQKEAAPIKALFTADGLVQLTQNMLEVLRWGLWMSPIINSFLRPMGEPTWYNQDGAIRTLIALFKDLTLSPDAFRAWSVQVFIYLLAYDGVRILIWLDHMGLRVATLVNLSFLGMDRLDERLARFLAPAATARCIPEGVKRFTTWAPLLIPFFIPRGRDWDYAWSQSENLQRQAHAEAGSALLTLPLAEKGLILLAALVAGTAFFALARWLRARSGTRSRPSWTLSNAVYEVILKENGEVFSQTRERSYDVSRRSYDLLDPAGRTLFVVDTTAGAAGLARAWPVLGNFPEERAARSDVEQAENSLRIANTSNDLHTRIEISLPDADAGVELWTITVENPSNTSRRVKVVPYLEWVLNRPDADRGHTQYNRLFAEMEYRNALQGVLAWDKHSKALGLLAADVPPEGFLSSRMDFIGRGRSLWTPRVLETLAFTAAQDTEAHPTFDPIGSLLLGVTLLAHGSCRLRLLIGLTNEKTRALDLIARHLQLPGAQHDSPALRRADVHPVGHGEVPPGTPQPYFDFSEDGRTLRIHTPFTPRPYDHTLSNSLGHVVALTNRGLHTSSSVNSQQNRLTPDWSDTVTREVPAEAFYLYDPERREWYAPTYHPVNDVNAVHEVEFGVDGTAVFRMTRDTLETELTVFVPPDEPAGVYMLTVSNHGDAPRRLRLVPYFQMVLASQPEFSGPLAIRFDASRNALFFINPRNTYRTGPAFVALSQTPERVETRRGPFFGAGRSVAHPHLAEQGAPAASALHDDRPIAAFLTTLQVPPRGSSTVVVVLGQADNRQQAMRVIDRYRTPAAALASLKDTRSWWRKLMDTVGVQTTSAEFDQYLNWLKYQALAERIWARRGFYQASGAYGFRDQLQDAVNLLWMDPVLARRQILLHSAQQFLEGDVVHWFHRLQDGRTGFVGRTHASDNLLWLAWAVVEYVAATGDDSLLEERAPYLEAEQPLPPLPAGKHGMGFDPLRSSREDSVYRHCLKAIDLVLDKRLGSHGLPLMGTGDWNDGLDEIGSRGRGESVWLGFFLIFILERMTAIVARKEGAARQKYYLGRLQQLKEAVELTWREDRYLRAFHDDGTEIGVAGSGVWEIDALTAAWAVMSGINPRRGRIVFETALNILEKEQTILLGWPPLREDSKPYLGRSSIYPAGVRENGMYCHGVQWLVGAARILSEQARQAGNIDDARRFRDIAYRLWLKISPLPHVHAATIETYGGQPNKQAADMVTTFDPGRMIWNGYTGAAGWLFRQALEGVLGLRLVEGRIVHTDLASTAALPVVRLCRDVLGSPFQGPVVLRPPRQDVASGT